MTNKFELTELYDKLSQRKNSYVVCFDIKNLMKVNDKLGRSVGDDMIKECIRRIDSAMTGDMHAFRIGGDEFVVLTGSKSREQAEAFRLEVCKKNREEITSNGVSFPVSMHSGVFFYGDGDPEAEITDKFGAVVLDNKVE